MDYRVISIGSLSRHELWPRDRQPRTPHATTTLIRSGDRVILVDPGLPPKVIAARLTERSGLEAKDITDVFLTNFRPAHRWGLDAFSEARWWIGQAEREAVGISLIERLRLEEEPAARAVLEQEIALLRRCEPAPDRLAERVDLFPLPGYTPGGCGLLLCHPTSTTLIAGDAVPTVEHLEQGRILPSAFDLDQAKESFMEAVEIADLIVPGHDNLVVNPARRGIN